GASPSEGGYRQPARARAAAVPNPQGRSLSPKATIRSGESRLAKSIDLLQPIVWIRTELPNAPASRRWIRYLLGAIAVPGNAFATLRDEDYQDKQWIIVPCTAPCT